MKCKISNKKIISFQMGSFFLYNEIINIFGGGKDIDIYLRGDYSFTYRNRSII